MWKYLHLKPHTQFCPVENLKQAMVATCWFISLRLIMRGISIGGQLCVSGAIAMDLLWICYEFAQELLWVCFGFTFGFALDLLWICHAQLLLFLICYGFAMELSCTAPPIMDLLWICFEFALDLRWIG